MGRLPSRQRQERQPETQLACHPKTPQPPPIRHLPPPVHDNPIRNRSQGLDAGGSTTQGSRRRTAQGARRRQGTATIRRISVGATNGGGGRCLCMCLPRLVLPGRCYLVTRRCSERRFLMRPDDQTTRAFLYCLAVSARRSQVQVIFFLAMSNHYHAGIFDPEGRLPAFLEHFHKLFARHQNVLRGRWENFWSSEQTSVVELLEAEDVLNKMVYTLANPVKAALVARAHEWPGATSLTAHLHGESIRTVRPTVFFRPDGPMPDEELLTVTLPPFMMGESIEQFRATLRERIAVVEDREAALRLQTGRRVLGVRAVLRQRWFDRPNTVAPRRKPIPVLRAVTSSADWRRWPSTALSWLPTSWPESVCWPDWRRYFRPAPTGYDGLLVKDVRSRRRRPDRHPALAGADRRRCRPKQPRGTVVGGAEARCRNDRASIGCWLWSPWSDSAVETAEKALGSIAISIRSRNTLPRRV